MIGYTVQVTSIYVGHNGPWTGATTGCADSETQSSTTKSCTVTGLADGTYAFRDRLASVVVASRISWSHQDAHLPTLLA